MSEWTSAHHRVLYLAAEGFNLQAQMQGIGTWAGSEQVTVLKALAPDEARSASVDLLRGGYLTVSHCAALAGRKSEADRDLDTEEALALLDDPRTWDMDSEEGIQQAWVHELHITPSGRELFDQLHPKFGKGIDEIDERVRAENDRVEREHPEFVEAKEQYLRDIERWVDSGEGEMPEPPPWPDR